MGLKAVVPLHFVWTSPYCFLARLLSNFCFQPWWLTRQTWMGGLTLLEWLVVRALGREHPSQLFIVSLWLVWSEARPSWQIQEAACKKQGKKVSPGIIWGKCDKWLLFEVNYSFQDEAKSDCMRNKKQIMFGLNVLDIFWWNQVGIRHSPPLGCPNDKCWGRGKCYYKYMQRIYTLFKCIIISFKKYNRQDSFRKNTTLYPMNM